MKVIDAADDRYADEAVLRWESNVEGRRADSLSNNTNGVIVGGLDGGVVNTGDVIRLREQSSLVSVLYRRGANANTLFTTDRCNSLCLMCSQPPRDVEDSWRVAELLQLIPLIDPDVPFLGVTGGEPTLLGDGLIQILHACRAHLPKTHLHVLTNGRSFADPVFARGMIEAGGDQTTWAIPLYADNAAVHDEVVAAPGAFQETIEGFYNASAAGARVEVRIVLHALTTPRLGALARYIYRRMPFAEHVAFMGLEPMGLAKRNRERLWIDPIDYKDALAGAVFFLHERGLSASIYNLPLCVLPRTLWPFARKSISDWKNKQDGACAECVVADHCAGFFASAGPAWRSRAWHAIGIGELTS